MVIGQSIWKSSSYLIIAYQHALLPECFRDNLCSFIITMRHQGNSEMALLYFEIESESLRGYHRLPLFFISYNSSCACSSSAGGKILRNISVKFLARFEYAGSYTLSAVFPQNASKQTLLVRGHKLLLWKYSITWYVNHRRKYARKSEPVEMIKTTNAFAPSYREICR